MSDIRSDITRHIAKKFGAAPEHLWARWPNYVVFRHGDNQKWFAIIMDVPRKTMNLAGAGTVDIINVKCESILMGALRGTPGYRPAYHMSKANWISVILDGTVSTKEIFNLIDLSYKLTAK